MASHNLILLLDLCNGDFQPKILCFGERIFGHKYFFSEKLKFMGEQVAHATTPLMT